jgi:hypothetical protein
MTYKDKNIKYTKTISRGKCFFTLEDENVVYEVPKIKRILEENSKIKYKKFY